MQHASGQASECLASECLWYEELRRNAAGAPYTYLRFTAGVCCGQVRSQKCGCILANSTVSYIQPGHLCRALPAVTTLAVAAAAATVVAAAAMVVAAAAMEVAVATEVVAAAVAVVAMAAAAVVDMAAGAVVSTSRSSPPAGFAPHRR